MNHKYLKSICLAGLSLTFASTAALADSISVSGDTFIRSDQTTTISSSSAQLLVGSLETDANFRSILKFDLSAYAGDTFENVSLDLFGAADDSGSADGSSTLSLYVLNVTPDTVNADWDGPTSVASWSNDAGGVLGTDFGPTLLSSTTADAGSFTLGTEITFGDSEAFESALNDAAGSTISFIITSSSESVSGERSLFRFASQDNTTEAYRPSLNFSVIPEPSSYALGAGLLALGAIATRRRN
jgi:hypothetical protein